MAFMIYKKGRFRNKSNNFLILIIINHVVWKKEKRKIQMQRKQIIKASKLFTVVETLLQRETCPKRWFSNDTVAK